MTEKTENVSEADQALAAQLAELDSMLSEDFKPAVSAGAEPVASGSAASELDTAELCTSLITVSFAVMAARKGEHWHLKPAESEQLGAALAAVLEKYAPGFNAGPEAALILVALMVIGPRAMVDLKARRELRKQQQAEDTTTQPDQSRPPRVKPESEIIYGDKAES